MSQKYKREISKQQLGVQVSDMATVSHARPNGKTKDIKSNLWRKKLHRTDQGSNFLGGSFSNRDNVRASIQFRGERDTQHLKRWFFFKNWPIHFHINSTRVIKQIKGNILTLSSIEINKPLPAQVYCVS